MSARCPHSLFVGEVRALQGLFQETSQKDGKSACTTLMLLDPKRLYQSLGKLHGCIYLGGVPKARTWKVASNFWVLRGTTFQEASSRFWNCHRGEFSIELQLVAMARCCVAFYLQQRCRTREVCSGVERSYPEMLFVALPGWHGEHVQGYVCVSSI